MKRTKTNDQEYKLYVVPTPIGNIEDITYRAVRILSEVDYIFAEDTRNSIKLLNHYDIKTKLKSCHDHNESLVSKNIIDLIKDNHNVALISDAGMPVINDPGFKVINEAIAQDISVCVLPGPSAFLNALVVSGLEVHPFLFNGFLSQKTVKRKKELESYKYLLNTLVFYESPHRIIDTLKDINEVLGDRQVVIVREISKLFEEVIRGKVSELISNIESLKGEIVLLVEGYTIKELSDDEIIDIYNNYSVQLSTKDAIKKIVTTYNIPKNRVYNLVHKED